MSQFRGRNLSDAEFAAIVREPPEFTLEQLCDHLRVPRHYLNHLARKDQRRAGAVKAGSHGELGMLRLMRQLAVATAKLIYPAKPEDLLARAGLDLGAGHQGERRRKRARGNSAKSQGSALFSTVVELYDSVGQRSIERRVLRAVLVKGLTLPQLSSQPGKAKSLVGGDARARGYDDFDTMAAGDSLARGRKSYSRFSDEQLTGAVNALLSPDNISPLSYGVRNVKLAADETITLPVLQAKQSVKQAYKCYKTSTIDHGPLKRTAFHALSATIITQERQLRTAVDYVLGILVHEPVSAAQDVINYFLRGDPRKELTSKLTLAMMTTTMMTTQAATAAATTTTTTMMMMTTTQAAGVAVLLLLPKTTSTTTTRSCPSPARRFCGNAVSRIWWGSA